MTFEYLQLTEQAATSHWGWTIALFLWLVGLSGMSLFLNAWLRSKLVTYIAAAAGVLGTLLVLSHLTRIWNLPMAAINALLKGSFNFTSWMFIGICLLAVLCIVTVLQSLALYFSTAKGSRCPFAESSALAYFNAVLGVAATIYSGFLLTQAQGVPLWNTAALPILWICSGLASAIGAAEILKSTGKFDGRGAPWLGGAANGVHVAEAIVLFAFVATALSGTPGAQAGAAMLLKGDASMLFWGGAVVVGIIVPLFASWKLKGLEGSGTASGFCSIAGALALRASVLFAGYFDPTMML